MINFWFRSFRGDYFKQVILSKTVQKERDLKELIEILKY